MYAEHNVLTLTWASHMNTRYGGDGLMVHWAIVIIQNAVQENVKC